MGKKKIISMTCGFVNIVTIVIMIFRLASLAEKHAMHPEWSLGVGKAVQLMTIFYGAIIGISTIVLVIVSFLKDEKKKNG